MSRSGQPPRRRDLDVAATRRRLGLLGVVLVVVAALLLVDVSSAGALTRLDGAVAGGLHGWFTGRPWAEGAAKAVSLVGSSAVGVPVVLAVVAGCLRRRAHRLALFALLTPALGKALERTLKVIVARDRPVWNDPLATAAGYSFPSGHAMGVTLVVGVLAVVLLPPLPGRWRRPLVALGVAWALLVSFTRLALGVHYLTDVVAGILLGGAWLATMAALLVPQRVASLSGWRGAGPGPAGCGGSPAPGSGAPTGPAPAPGRSSPG